MLLSVNNCDNQLPGLVISVILFCVGGWLLKCSRANKIRSMMIGWQMVTGKDAKFWSTVFAVILLSLGVVVLLSAIFGWSC